MKCVRCNQSLMEKVCIKPNGDAGFICDICGLVWVGSSDLVNLEKVEKMKEYEDIFNYFLTKLNIPTESRNHHNAFRRHAH